MRKQAPDGRKPALENRIEQETHEEPCFKQVQIIETNCGPEVESALLRDLLTRSPEPGPQLEDSLETRHSQPALAGVAAYKHRLQSIRTEYVHVLLRSLDLEAQLNEACATIELLEKRVAHFSYELQEMRASRAWKTAENWHRWLQTVSGWFRRFRG
jgi:hypothetical protein